ncbi:hypothetical protein ACJMK2_008861, partial [Sinanodonta woodiana]
PVTIKKLLVALVLVVVDPSINFHVAKSSAVETYDPAKLVTEILKGLCSSEQVCETCLFKDEITSTLLSPISHFLDVADHQTPSESTLLHVADILCMIASSTKGRRHLIYGEKKDVFTRTKSSAAHIIAEFTKKALLKDLPKEAGQAPSQAVIGSYLYICHQLYNTCEGLLVLYPYELHASVAKAYQQASQEAESVPTPTPIEDDDSSSDSSSLAAKESYDLLHWEDTLRDNLLNFASTAKGILLLQQTGALNECIVYMNARYEKKLQVSKCEKFGYGYMVTQLAATAPGMAALEKTGYLKALISELWAVLECGPSDAPLFTPKSWPVDPVERISHKHLIRLLNVLSAFPAVYEVLATRPLPTKDSYTFREMPDTIAGFLDRLVLLNSPAKVHSLFNVEQSHAFGLRVLSVMISCLDTHLLLQAQYKFQECLLSDQADNLHHTDSNEIIVDCLSVERNNILVRSYQLGGPSERTLPPRIIKNMENPYPYPMFTSYPIPKEYISNQGRSAMKQDNELIKFLDSKKPEKGKAWLEKCRTILVKLLQTKPEQVKGKVVQKLLEQAAAVMTTITEEAIFPLLQFSGNDSSVKKFNLSPLQSLGIKIAVRYGIHLKVIHTSSEATEKLGHLLKKCALFLQQQQKPVDSKLLYLQGSYPGFDWFASTIFIIFSGNNEKSWEFLHEFSTLGASGYLWMPRLHASVHLPTALMSSGIPPLFSSTGHNIELILQIELPLVASAFRMSGYTPTQICLHWLKQCFWNYLDWFDICHYVCVCLIMGIDYQVYLCVAILKHLQKQVMEHMQTQDLIIFLKEEPIHEFHVSKNLKYMQELEKKYRKIILPDLLNITKP